MAKDQVRFSQRVLSIWLSGLLATQPLLPAIAATITPSGGTQMDKAANGVPVVNIATPNGAGISHNKYQDYNVGKEGLILNNATGRLNQTQLGGLIQNNPHLKAGQEAKGIINEVTGTNRSQLHGYTEVAGKAANVMVANPYGITCNGCGFINTPNATLTTGKPVLDANGALQSLDVTKGSITIEGQGLDASQSDAVSIIARATEINAALHAKDLTVTTGANRVSASGNVTALKGEGDVPKVAIDTGALGGMYANRIHLVASEKGVGVNLGNLTARQGDISLDVNGKLTVNNSYASGATAMKGQNVSLSGEHKAGGAMTVTSREGIALQHATVATDSQLQLNASGALTQTATTLTAGKNVALNGKSVAQDAASQTNAGQNITLAAQNDAALKGKTTAGNSLTASAGALSLEGSLDAKGTMALNASQINNSGSVQGSGLALAGTTLTNRGTLNSTGALDLTAGTVNQQGNVGATGDIRVSATQTLTNSGTVSGDNALNITAGQVQQNGTISGANAIALTASSFFAGAGSTTHSDGAVTLHATQMSLGGETSAGGNLSLTGETLSTAAAAQTQSGAQLTIAGDTLTLAGTQAGQSKADIQATNTLTQTGKTSAASVDFRAATLDNQGGVTADTLTVQSNTLTNSGLLQGAAVTLNAGQLINNGDLNSSGTLAVTADDFSQQGKTGAKDDATITVHNQLDNSGTLVSDSGLTLTAGDIRQNGTLTGAQSLSLSGATLNTGAGSLTESAGAMQLSADAITHAGEIWAGGNLTLNGTTITTAESALTQSDGSLLVKGMNALLVGTQIAAKALTVETTDSLTHSGKSRGDSMALSATTLTNSGTLLAPTLSLTAGAVTNSGALVADNALALNTRKLTNQASGSLYSAADLTLNIPQIINNGLLTSDGKLTLGATSLNNAGQIAADRLAVDSATLSGDGLLQGAAGLELHGDTLSQGQSARWLSAGDINITAGTLSTAGTTQGQAVSATVDNWNHQGSLVALEQLTATLKQTLENGGDLLSKGALTLNSDTLKNSGNILAVGQMLLSGNLLNNSGALQGDTLTVKQNRIDNPGSMIGMSSLTLDDSGALTNGGKLLSQGALTVKAGDVTNGGSWQADSLSLAGNSLNNSGVLQSANNLQLTLAQDLVAAKNSKITALGAMTFSAAGMNNSGLWSAKSLSLKGNTLANQGEISGVNGLTIGLQGAMNQQGNVLTGGTLDVTTTALTNSGQIQGNQSTVKAQSLENSGRVQGDSNLTLTLVQALTNHASGTLIAQNSLGITASQMTSDGTIQGNGTTTLAFSKKAVNNGKLLSGGDITLSTPDYSGKGTLQATSLLLNVANFANMGTTVAENTATLTGNQLTNSGLFQAQMLNVNAQTLNNSGTLLGRSGLTVKSGTVTQNNGKLYSGGDLLVNATTLTGAGEIVAMGNLTATLINAFTTQGAMASGKQLTLSSQGAITNQHTLQGNGLTLSAGGKLVNNGTLTAGTGSSALSGSEILLDKSGSLQAGGDVALTSAGNITLNGFTGTAGSLTLNTAGTLLNAALLYAGQNMKLFASRIQNQHGDILAGDSLWMQKNASGEANQEVVNTSGTIETQRGDITVNTGSLLNQRDGLETKETHIDGADNIPGLGDATIQVSYQLLPEGSYGVVTYKSVYQVGSCNGHGACNYVHRTNYYYAGFKDSPDQRFLSGQTRLDVTSKGGASRIASGRNLSINANTLVNDASNILANNDIHLTGNELKNQSWQSGTTSDWLVYTFYPRSIGYATDTIESFLKKAEQDSSESGMHLPDADSTLTYQLKGHETESADGEIYRAVIQAGGNVNATFSSTTGNTTTTAHAGKITNTLTAPALNAPSFQQPGNGTSLQTLSDAGKTTLTQPDWQDITDSTLQDINAHTDGLTATGKPSVSVNGESAAQLAQSGINNALYPLPSGNNGYFVPSTDPDSPYLITVNPKLNGLGQLDASLFGDLYALLGIKPGAAPRETNTAYTDQNQFLGSSYFLDRLNLNPDYDYRFLGDAAFDTRYASNYLLNQTGSRYINGIGSDLDQMRYLIDSAAEQQKSLGLKFGVALTQAQVSSLDKSLIWWESTTINGQSVMVPKVYLSPKDVTINNGSVISGNNVQLTSNTITNNGSVISGNNVQLTSNTITNSGSTLSAQNGLTLDSSNSISNLNAGLISAGAGLNLSALGDINNVGSTISGKTVQLESVGGSINNITQAQQWDINGTSRHGNVTLSGTNVGNTAAITATDAMALYAGQDINVTGATVQSGGTLAMGAGNDINVSANQVRSSNGQSGFRHVTATSDTTVTNQGSTITAGTNLAMQAGNDLNVTASHVDAGGSALLTAGSDLNLNAADNSHNTRRGNSETHTSGVDSTTVSAGDNVTLIAGRDVTSQAAGIAAEGNVGIQAGRDVNLLAEATVDGSSSREKKKTVIDESVRQQSTEIASGGNTTIIAGQDVNAQAAQVTAQGDIGVGAGRDVNLTTATESDYHYYEQTKTKKGFLSKKTTHTIEEDSATREAGTLLSGDNVTVQAGNNLLVKGSNVVGDGDVALHGGNNVDILAATNSDTAWRFKETKKSGLMGSGGIGFTIGSNKTTHDLREQGTTQSQSFSTVGSTGGSVSVSAGNQTHISGADLIAGKNLSVSGDSVVIDPGHDKRTRDEKFEQKSSGLTVALSGAVGGAINNAVSAAKEAKNESDSRLAALKTTKAVLSGYQAEQGHEQAQLAGDPNNGVGISISLSTQKSQSKQHQESDAIAGSTLNAGNDLSVTATGKNGGANSGDILIGGSQLKAGGDTLLSAQNDILLSGAANTQKTTGSNSSSGGGVGISFGVGSGSGGLSVFASVNGAKGNEKGDGTEWTETTVDSGGSTTLSSGRDTTLTGAQVSGEKIVADIGRDLLLSSQQDSNNYNSKQNSFGAGGSFTFGSMTGSGYINVSQDKMKSTYDSVQEQTGLYAGKGGYDITVGNHTQLDGAVIASTATADKNSLSTGTLGFSDIHNEADYKVSHSGASISGGGDFGGKNFTGNMAGSMISATGSSGHAEGTTQSAISNGTLTVRDTAHQQQDVADLSRDTEHANDSISPIFNKEKEQKRLQAVQLISDIGSQAQDIVRTQGDIEALKAAKNAEGAPVLPENATEKERQNYLTALRNTQAYKDEMANYGTGSDMQRAIQGVTAGLTGLAGGNIAGALAGASAPELANLIGHHMGIAEDDHATKALAHAILGGVVASLQGNSVAAGAAGGATGELAAVAIAKALYPEVNKLTDLSEEQKQTVSALASVSAGIAGGLAGDSTSGAVAGAQAGKNSVENNALSDIAENKASGITQQEKYQKAQDALVKATEEFKAKNCAGLSTAACGAKMDAHRNELLAGFADAGSDFIPVYGDIKSFKEADSALGYLAAVVGIMPGLGDEAGALLKGADKALKAGDLEQASKLINDASHEINVKWVDENAGMSPRARDYNDSASGARSNIDTQKGQAPTIDRIDEAGKNRPVRFDGVDGDVMIDRKISVVTTPKAKNQAIRQSEALKNNGMTGRWEVPNQAQANRAQKMFDELGIKNIEVKIVHE